MHARTLLANCTQSQPVRFERCELTHAHDTVMLRIAASKRPAEWPTAVLHFGGDWLGSVGDRPVATHANENGGGGGGSGGGGGGIRDRGGVGGGTLSSAAVMADVAWAAEKAEAAAESTSPPDGNAPPRYSPRTSTDPHAWGRDSHAHSHKSRRRAHLVTPLHADWPSRPVGHCGASCRLVSPPPLRRASRKTVVSASGACCGPRRPVPSGTHGMHSSLRSDSDPKAIDSPFRLW